MRESVLQYGHVSQSNFDYSHAPRAVAVPGSGKSEPLDPGGLSLAHFLCLILSLQIKHSVKSGRKREE